MQQIYNLKSNSAARNRFDEAIVRYAQEMVDPLSKSEVLEIDIDEYTQCALDNLVFIEIDTAKFPFDVTAFYVDDTEEAMARFTPAFRAALYEGIFYKFDDGEFHYFRDLPADRGEVRMVWCLSFTKPDGLGYETDNYEAGSRQQALADALSYLQTYHEEDLQ